MSKAVNDKYFTKPSVVIDCIKKINLTRYDYILEPSAGCGSFLSRLPKDKAKGIDIQPDIPEVIKLDFYSIGKVINLLGLKTEDNKKYLSIGNPPFGKMSTMAIDFFNGCALFSDTIAFILPRTFRKASVINKLDKNFCLREEYLLPEDSFLILDPSQEQLTRSYDVPCVFQIWDKTKQPRKKIITLVDCEEFEFVKDRKTADFAVRRVGVKAGNTYDITDKISSESHYFVKQKENDVRNVIDKIVWDYNSAKYDVAGNPSISKDELISQYKKHKKT